MHRHFSGSSMDFFRGDDWTGSPITGHEMGKYWTKPPIPNMQLNKSLKPFRAGFLPGPQVRNRNMRSHSSAINWHSSASNSGGESRNPKSTTIQPDRWKSRGLPNHPGSPAKFQHSKPTGL